MRTLRILLISALFAACGDSGGCGGSYPYPRTDAEALPTQKAMRARITETGFTNIARATPGLIAASCAGNPANGTAACAMDPIQPQHVRFYLGTVSQPMTFNVSGLGPGGMRRAGVPAGYPGSVYELYNETLAGNMHIDLVQDGQGGGLRVTLGCPSLSNCAQSQWVLMGIDAIVYFDDAPLYGQEACFVQDGNGAGLTIKQFQFVIRPQVELGADGRPYLLIRDEDITIGAAEMSSALQIDSEPNDPYCLAGECSGSFCGTAELLVEGMLSTGVLAKFLARQIADAVVGQFDDTALEAVGALDVSALIPTGAAYANPTAYLIGANVDSPRVSGSTGSLGQNYDFDAGFAASPSPCIRHLDSLSWTLPPLPDPGAMVLAPDPTTGELAWEPFDLALLVGDVVLGRAAYELYDGGGLCLDIAAEELGEVTGGGFVPTVAAFDLLAPGMSSLAPASAPVDLRVMPQLPPIVRLGSGQVVDGVKDSHVQLVWPNVWVEMYPLVDAAHLDAITFQFTLNAGISIEAAPGGNLLLTVDDLALTDLGEVWNEMNLRFDAEGVAQLASIFLPSLISSEPIDVGLTASSLGVPFVPKFRAVETFDENPFDTRDDPRRFLSMMLRFCADEDIADPTNALCHEPPPGAPGNAPTPGHLAFEAVRAPTARGTARFSAFSDLEGAGDLQLAFRVDATGPYFSFRSADADSLYTLEHPLLAVAGPHLVTAMARRRGDPYTWSEPASVEVRVDHVPPWLEAWREQGGVRLLAFDDQTPAERLLVRARVGDEDLGFAARSFVAAPPEREVTLWAMDESGLLSEAVRLAPEPPPAEGASRPERGCAAVGGAWLAAGALLMLVARRRRS